MAWDQAVALLVIGSIFLLFNFAKNLDGTEKAWLQAIKLLIYGVGLFYIPLSLGFGIRILETNSAHQTMINMVSIMYISSLFIVIPVVLIFLVMFIKELAEFWKSMSDETNFEKG